MKNKIKSRLIEIGSLIVVVILIGGCIGSDEKIEDKTGEKSAEETEPVESTIRLECSKMCITDDPGGSIYGTHTLCVRDCFNNYDKKLEIPEIRFPPEPISWVECDSCESCAEAIKNAAKGTGVKLIEDIEWEEGTCIHWSKDNITFDCQNHTIDGWNMEDYYGIYLDRTSGNTIRNCIITYFDNGIKLYGSDDNIIIDNSVNDNFWGIYIESYSYRNIIINNTATGNIRGIHLYNGNENYIASNAANDNEQFGIYLVDSYKNIIINNAANNNDAERINGGGGIELKYSLRSMLVNNTVNSNPNGIVLSDSNHNKVIGCIACSNAVDDIYGGSGYDNFGGSNTCDKIRKFNDTDTLGCTYKCS